MRKPRIRKRKNKRYRYPLENSDPPQKYFWNGLEFSKKEEREMAEFLVEKNIESKTEMVHALAKFMVEKKILPRNESEIRFARILYLNKLPFEYSKKVKTKKIILNREMPDTSVKDKGVITVENFREIDFWLTNGPVKIPLYSDAIQAFEIKGGNLIMHSWVQRRELSDSGYETFIVLPEDITFWERYGFLELNCPEKLAFFDGVYSKPKNLPVNFISQDESYTKFSLARILIENGIDFEYLEDMPRVNDNPSHRGIFFLRKPIKAFWCVGEMTQVIMVIEDDKTIDDYLRRREIATRYKVFMCTWQYPKFWRCEGFLRQKF